MGNKQSRAIKYEQPTQSIDATVRKLRKSVETYNGVRGMADYKALHNELSRKGQEVHKLLCKSKKPAEQKRYKALKKEVKSLVELLEDRVNINESQLDSAAVKSDSIIAAKPIKLDDIAHQANVLEKEIDTALALDDSSKEIFLEHKLKALHADLSKVDDSSGKILNRKESINRSLMKQGKKLQNLKQNKRRSGIIFSTDAVQKEQETIAKIEEALIDVEMKVRTFEGLNTDTRYRELDQLLKGYWATLTNLSDSTEDNRRKKLKTIDLIKTMLKELSKRSEDNSTKMNSILKIIDDIDDETITLKYSAENFWGVKNDAEYNDIDQKLQRLWSKLNDINSTYEPVVKRKRDAIQTVQNLLKALYRNADKNAGNESMRNSNVHTYELNEIERIVPKLENLLDDLEDVKKKWIALDKSISTITKSEEARQIISIVQDIKDLVTRNFQHLSESLTRNSTERVSFSNIKYEEKPLGKVTITQRETEQVRKLNNLNRSSEDGRNLSPPERLIKELTVNKILESLDMIEHEADVLKQKILQGEQTDDISKQELKRQQDQFIDLETCLNPTVVDQRNKVFQKLSEISMLLESSKPKQDTINETSKLKSIVEEVQKLKKRVDCFTGTYKSVLYNGIESGFMDCLKMLEEITSENEKNRKAKELLTTKIERYLDILEERSLKVSPHQNFTDAPISNFDQKTNNIMNLLSKIRACLEKFDGGPESASIKADIDRCEYMIYDLQPANGNQKIVRDQYVDCLQKYVLYFNSKISQEAANQIATPGNMLMQLEYELTELKNEITKLNVIENDTDFDKMQLTLDDLLLRVGSIDVQTPNDKEFRNNLQTTIQSLAALLKTKRRASKRMSQYNQQLNRVKLEEVQEAITKVSMKVYGFTSDNYRQNYDTIDAEMADIFLKIQRLDVDDNMREYLVRQIQSSKKILLQKHQEIQINSDKRGTEV